MNYPARKAFYQKYIVHTKRLAIAFLLFGLLGIFFPSFFGLTVAAFVGWLLFFSGIYAGYTTYQTDKTSIWGWLKSLLLIITGILMILNPHLGTSALAILMAVYLFVDSALNFMLGFNLKPAINKVWPFLNGVVSAILGVIFLLYAPNPLYSSWLLGLYVGISLLFDAIMMYQLSRGADKIYVEELIVEE